MSCPPPSRRAWVTSPGSRASVGDGFHQSSTKVQYLCYNIYPATYPNTSSPVWTLPHKNRYYEDILFSVIYPAVYPNTWIKPCVNPGAQKQNSADHETGSSWDNPLHLQFGFYNKKKQLLLLYNAGNLFFFDLPTYWDRWINYSITWGNLIQYTLISVVVIAGLVGPYAPREGIQTSDPCICSNCLKDPSIGSVLFVDFCVWLDLCNMGKPHNIGKPHSVHSHTLLQDLFVCDLTIRCLMKIFFWECNRISVTLSHVK